MRVFLNFLGSFVFPFSETSPQLALHPPPPSSPLTFVIMTLEFFPTRRRLFPSPIIPRIGLFSIDVLRHF